MTMSSQPSPPTQPYRLIAVGQLRTTSNKFANLLDAAKCAGWAKRDGCSMLFLPECFGFLGESSEETLKLFSSELKKLILEICDPSIPFIEKEV